MTINEIANNVKEWNSDINMYISNNNELYSYNSTNLNFEKIADNVEQLSEFSYCTSQKKVFVRGYSDTNHTDSGYNILNYGMKNDLWLKTNDKKLYLYYIGERIG